MKKLSIVLSALLLTIAFSCNDNSNLNKQNEIKVDENGITTLINYIDFNVNQIASSGFKDYGNQEALAKIIAANNTTFEKQYGVIVRDAKNARSSTDNLEYTTSKDSEVAQKLLSFSKTSLTEVDYMTNLSNLKAEVYSFNISTSEKQILLNKIVFVERLTQYMSAKSATFENSKTSKNNKSAKADPCNWWCSWGKCAAGIVGGAGTGALTFGLGGAAVGTATLPIVGTVSLGAVGAIGGAIAGGLTGAAASCD